MGVRRRFIDYQTTLPTSGGGLSSRRILASIASAAFHIGILILAIRLTASATTDAKAQQSTETERPVQLLFNPPTPQPRPQPTQVETPVHEQQPVKPPDAPLTPGEEQTPGSTARVVPDPEKDPNAAP